ncbi:MAG: PrsW family intramembrane metalloprotease [Actinomycetota bacterium]
MPGATTTRGSAFVRAVDRGTRGPALLVFLGLLVVTGVLAVRDQSAISQLSPGGWALSWGLLVLYALPVGLVLYALDLYEREPPRYLVAAFVWGAVIATQLSGIANAGWGLVVARAGGPEFAADWTAALTAPFVEEAIKGAGVVLVFLIAREQIDDVLDGFVYGAVCGLGFAIVEDVFYFVGVFGGTTEGVLQGFFVRVISSGLYGHVLYTGLVGMGIGYFVSHRRDAPLGRRVAVLAGLTAVGILGHVAWNSPWLDLLPAEPSGAGWLLVPIATAVKGVPLLAFVVVAVVLALGRERRWLREALGPEVGGPALSAAELATIEDPRRRRRTRRRMRARAGDRAAAILHRLHREQLHLAVVRTRSGIVHSGEAEGSTEPPEVAAQRDVCRSLRDALAAVPGAAPGGG